jgi:hypothetical protein
MLSIFKKTLFFTTLGCTLLLSGCWGDKDKKSDTKEEVKTEAAGEKEPQEKESSDSSEKTEKEDKSSEQSAEDEKKKS